MDRDTDSVDSSVTPTDQNDTDAHIDTSPAADRSNDTAGTVLPIFVDSATDHHGQSHFFDNGVNSCVRVE